MKSIRYIGVSFYKGRVQLAEIEHGKKVQVTTLAERETSLDIAQAGVNLTANHPQLSTFVRELRELYKQHKLSTEQISFALPPDPVFINIIPVDASLVGADIRKYIEWESAQYLGENSSADYLVDSHALPASNGSARTMFMVSVRKGMVAFIQKAVALLGLKLRFVDIDQFSAEKTLLANYPEILEHDIVLIGVRFGGIDASLIHEGQMTDYRAFHKSDARKAVASYLKYLKERDGLNPPAAILLHGIDITPQLVGALRSESGIQQTLPLNALRKIPATSHVYPPFIKESHRFASAIGLALRTQ